ncbi:hypothetical protein BKA69DRAFT_1081455 [Paraphysoderma sedebokerense]|nr:hypothetical protein BKA69DRAFT_1081455 [Paraphysoderma sedebokerense]
MSSSIAFLTIATLVLLAPVPSSPLPDPTSPLTFDGFATFKASNVTHRVRLARRAEGFATYYTKENGACGLQDDERRMDNVVALNAADYGFPVYRGPQCGKCVQVRFETGERRIYKITDMCPQTNGNCHSGDLDINEAAFPSSLREKGKVRIQWDFAPCNAETGTPNAAPPAETQKVQSQPPVQPPPQKQGNNVQNKCGGYKRRNKLMY